MPKATTIVRLKSFPNRTPTGRASATAARKLAMYFAYGRGRQAEQIQQPQRGVWHDEKGQPITHEVVMAWVQEQGKANSFTHQFILSAKYAHLTPEAYGQAMQAGGDLFPEWRMLTHQDTCYSHAHALAFGEKEVRIKGAEFQAWQRRVRAALEESQKQQLAHELALQTQQQALSPMQPGAKRQEETDPLQGAQRQAEEQEERQLSRGWGLEM